METPRGLIIIPCFNEAGNIVPLLRDLSEAGIGLDVLVIDDCSTDNTFRLASALVPTVRLPVNLGIGGAVQTGIKYALRKDYAFCVQMDGDGQHPPRQLSKLVEEFARGEANLVVGSRFLEKSGFQSTFFRRVGISLIRITMRLLTGQWVTDPTSGYRLLDRRAIELMAREYPTDYPEPVSLVMARTQGLKVREVPITMQERRQGQSSITGIRVFAYMVRVTVHMMMARAKGLV